MSLVHRQMSASRGERLRTADEAVLAVRQLPAWRGVLALLGSLAAVWGLNATVGGAQTSLPHLFYLPVILAVVLFGTRGGLTVAATATLLAGPLMPGPEQGLTNWLVRGVMLGVVALAVSASLNARDTLHRERVRDDLTQALDLDRTLRPRADDILVRRVPQVLADGSFTVVYQPVVSLSTGEVIAAEALTRFPGRDAPPDAWFHAAHEAGLGPQLELATIDVALRGAVVLSPRVALCLNVSPATLADPALGELLDRHERPVVLELTEHDVVGDYPALRACLEPLRASGARVAVDDAGAGVASLRHVVRLAPDLIKLDASLVRGVRTSPVLHTLGRSVVDFARATGTLLVVEGVEDPRDLQTWTDLGADAAQGFLLGRPGPPDRLRRRFPVPGRARPDAA